MSIRVASLTLTNKCYEHLLENAKFIKCNFKVLTNSGIIGIYDYTDYKMSHVSNVVDEEWLEDMEGNYLKDNELVSMAPYEVSVVAGFTGEGEY